MFLKSSWSIRNKIELFLGSSSCGDLSISAMKALFFGGKGRQRRAFFPRARGSAHRSPAAGLSPAATGHTPKCYAPRSPSQRPRLVTDRHRIRDCAVCRTSRSTAHSSAARERRIPPVGRAPAPADGSQPCGSRGLQPSESRSRARNDPAPPARAPPAQLPQAEAVRHPPRHRRHL